MPVKIDQNYREKLSRVFKRNIKKDTPMTGIVSLLASFRNLDREIKLEGMKQHARERVEIEKMPPVPTMPLIGNDAGP